MAKEKCNCEYKMLASLVTGVVLGLVGGLAIGWGGAQYPSDTNFILSFLTAFGTVGAAVGAVYAAYIALTVSKREANRERDEKEKYINTQVQILSEWGNRAAASLRELDRKLQKLEQTPSLWKERDHSIAKSALERLKTDSLPLSLDKIHNFPNGEAWAFCISRAATLYKDLQERFEDRTVKDPSDLSDVLLRDYIDEMLHVLGQISVLFIWHEYDDAE